MRRSITLATLALALALVPQFASAGPWLKSVSEAQAEAKRTNHLILVDMFAEWCGWCHRMEREVFPSEKFQAISKNYVLLRLDTEDRKDGSKMASALGVTSLPTFVVLTPDLEIAGFIRGYNPTDQFVAKIEQVEGSYYDFQKKLKSESAKTADSDRLDLAKELLSRRSFPAAEARFTSLTKSSNAAVRDEAYYSLATMQAQQGKFDVAKRTIKSALAINSKGEFGEKNQLLLGNIYLEQQNLPAALAEFKRFKARYPGSQMIPSIDQIVPQLEQAISKK